MDSCTIVGVDCATDPKNVGLACGTWQKGRPTSSSGAKPTASYSARSGKRLSTSARTALPVQRFPPCNCWKRFRRKSGLQSPSPGIQNLREPPQLKSIPLGRYGPAMSGLPHIKDPNRPRAAGNCSIGWHRNRTYPKTPPWRLWTPMLSMR